MNHNEAAQKVLKANPKATNVFTTSDGQVFFTENHASNHARNLSDKKVEKVCRGEATVNGSGEDNGDRKATQNKQNANPDPAAKTTRKAPAKKKSIA